MEKDHSADDDGNTNTGAFPDVSKMKKEEIVETILELQKVLGTLNSDVEERRSQNGGLRIENNMLKEYIDNLMSKVGRAGGRGLKA